MLANLKGTVLEKFTRERNTDSGKVEKLYVRLYQEGEKVLLDVNVKADTYSAVEVGQIIVLEDIKVNSYKDNLYALQV